MTYPILSFEQVAELNLFEQDWLFEKFLLKLNSHRHLLLTAEQNWGIQDYVKELGFQLEERYRDIQTCYVDVRLAQSSLSFLKLFQTTLSHRFQVPVSQEEADTISLTSLKLPSVIARKKGIRVAVFISNIHLFYRFKDAASFLRTLRLYLKNQKKCIFCLYGNDSGSLREMIHAPGSLSGLGQLFKLRHDPSKHRSAGIRKLFHEHNKGIDFSTSIHMSYLVDNHPFYLRLLAWHALIRTRNQCTMITVDKALIDLILHFEHQFIRIVESLTTKQLNYLKASVEVGGKICSEAVLQTYQLGSSGNVARIKQSLAKREILYPRSRDSVFVDPVFREWLRIRYFKTGSTPDIHW